MPDLSSNYSTLSAMITPALFLTANGSLIISTSNRLARIADRVRMLNENLDHLSRAPGDLDFVPDRLALTEELLDQMLRRSDHVRVALIMLYLALASFAGTSLTLAIDVWVWHRIFAVPTALAVLGVFLLLGASVRLVREALAALRGNDREIRFYRDLQARRHAGDEGFAGPVPIRDRP
ncbi:MAG: hypothetical protein JWN86_3790 [Planctomycetota bacterium]|nr:hypothetical protein [Planctomycetota bacterium]